MAEDDDAMIAPPLSGFRLVPAYLDAAAQKALLAELSAVFAAAPLYTPRMPKSGKPLSVRMTNCGPLGWSWETTISAPGSARTSPGRRRR